MCVYAGVVVATSQVVGLGIGCHVFFGQKIHLQGNTEKGISAIVAMHLMEVVLAWAKAGWP